MTTSDIQARLAEINARAAEAQAKRDRQFWTLIGFHMLVVVLAFFAFVSIPRAQSAWHQQQLANQENVTHG